MGASASNQKRFSKEFAKFKPYVDALETERPVSIYSKFFSKRFKSPSEMHAVTTLIYDKAIQKPALSMKCVFLLKLFKEEVSMLDGEKFAYPSVFDDFFQPYIQALIESMRDRKLTAPMVQCTQAIALFLGNLLLVDFYTKNQIMAILQLVRKRPTPNGTFFLNIVKTTIAEKLGWSSMSSDVIDKLIDSHRPSPDTEKPNDTDTDCMSDEEEPPKTKFQDFVKKIHTGTDQGFFDDYKVFENLSDDIFIEEVKFLLHMAFDNNHEHCLSVYKNVILEIHRRRPNLTFACLQNELFMLFVGIFKQHEARGVYLDFHGIDAVGVLVGELYSAALIEDVVVEKFLEVTKPSNTDAFIRTFMDVLRKYRGNMPDDFYYIFLQKIQTYTIWNPVRTAVEDFLVGTKDKSIGSKK